MPSDSTPTDEALDLPPILTRADPADIPALVAEITRLRAALEQSIARGAVAVEEARVRVKALTSTYTPKAGAEAEDLRRCLERYTDGPLADEMRAILDEVDARDSLRWLEERAADKARIAALESAPTFADGVRAGLRAAATWADGDDTFDPLIPLARHMNVDGLSHDARAQIEGILDAVLAGAAEAIRGIDPSTVKP